MTGEAQERNDWPCSKGRAVRVRAADLTPSHLVTSRQWQGPASCPASPCLLPVSFLSVCLGPQLLGAAGGLPGEKSELHISYSIFTT